MPDISMCKGISSDKIECDKCSCCYRYTARPNPDRQSYFMFAPLTYHIGETEMVQKCDYFWPLKEKK